MKKEVYVVTTGAEIEAAIAQANLREEYRPKAVAVEYREKSDSISVMLASGIELVIPRRILQGLEHATPAQLKAVEIVGAESGLHWPQLNVDHYGPASK